jgi:CheY-like chemotaxis protein
VTLSVSDTGAGMDEATRARVFEPFFTTKPVGRGTGLGLSTVYGIVTQTGGHIVVESATGRGTRFDVYLPRARGTSSPLVSESIEEIPPLRPSSVLLVDDLAEVREALATSLRASGLTVWTASSAEEALAFAEETAHPIDALVSDVAMPGRSGLELAEALLARRPGLRVLLVSGALQGEEQVLPPKVQFLQKPFSGDQLARALLELLGRPRF